MEHGTFVGWIGDDVLHSLYRIADVCVVPSIYEPFGLVALEAMASSCPCIVADTGGLREVVPHDEVGLRFRAKDPESLAEMTVRVLDDAELCRRLTAEAFEHLRRFDWGDVAERTAASTRSCRGRAAGHRGLMSRLPEGRREVRPSREAPGERRGPELRPDAQRQRADLLRPAADGGRRFLSSPRSAPTRLLLWIIGGVFLVAGVLLFASGKRL